MSSGKNREEQKLKQKANSLEQESKTNQGIISALLENSKGKNRQVTEMMNLLSKV